MPGFGSGRYANVTSTMALVVALGGTAYAANTVRSSDIVNGQVKSVDIGNKQVKSADLANRAVTSIKVRDRTLLAKDFKLGELPAGPRGAPGAPGATGVTGATGATGATGPRGPSAAFQVAADGPTAVNPADTSLLTLALPAAGSYVLTSKVYLNNNNAADTFVQCRITVGADVDVSSTGIQSETGEDDHRTLGNVLATTTAGPASAVLSCRHFAGGTTLANDMRLVAVQVASLN